MDFVGRHEEVERLNSLCRRRQGGLAVLTGRRRVGKTRLLVEWNRRHDGLYTVADQSAPEIQRRYFCEALAGRFPVFQEATFRDWRAILKALARQAEAGSWKGPLILDEFPFLVASSPELPSVVQHWIDQDAAAAGLVVAIAGSSQRMMHGLVLIPRPPSTGALSRWIEVKPLRMADFTAATGVVDPVTCVKAYAAWAAFLATRELAEPFAARVDEAVDRCVLRSALRLCTANPTGCCLTRYRPHWPCARSSTLSVSVLIDPAKSPRASDSRHFAGASPHAPHRDGSGPSRDPFWRKREIREAGALSHCRPVHAPVVPNRRTPSRALGAGPFAVRRDLWVKERPGLFASAWEELCRQSVVLSADTRSSLAHKGPWAPAARYWQGRGPEWDVVSRSLDGKRGLLGEVKWSERAFRGPSLVRLQTAFAEKGVRPCSRRFPISCTACSYPKAEDASAGARWHAGFRCGGRGSCGDLAFSGPSYRLFVLHDLEECLNVRSCRGGHGCTRMVPSFPNQEVKVKPGHESQTAIMVCAARAAAHGRTAVAAFTDPTALALLPENARLRVERFRSGVPPTSLRERLRFAFLDRRSKMMVARTVSIDAAIREAGFSQVVILGAGLDGRAWRMPELADATVFEVDHPDSQREKRVRAASLKQAAHDVRFVPVDFTPRPPRRRARICRSRSARPTTWVWEGVVMYLERADIEATLRVVEARSAPRSRLVVLYHSPSIIRKMAGVLPAPDRRAGPLCLHRKRNARVARGIRLRRRGG